MDPMELKIVLFDSLRSDASDNANLIRKWLKPLDIKEEHRRKFIVVSTQEGPEKLYVAIGPQFVDNSKHPDFYTHDQLREIVLEVLGYEKYEMAGGGAVTFRKGMFSERWEAHFADFSRSYGVWDFRVLGHRQTIADWLGLKATFEWQGYAEPKH